MDDPPLASGLAVRPERTPSVDAARRGLVLERMILQGVELPELLAGRGVERHHAEISGGEVHHAIDDDRRAFDRLPGAALKLAGVVRPGRLEPGDVLPVDLIQRGISHAAGVVADAGPIDRLRSWARPAGECEQTREADQARTHSEAPQVRPVPVPVVVPGTYHVARADLAQDKPRIGSPW